MRLLAAFGCFALSAFAQISTGTLTGTVTDPSGASIVGARVTLRHLATAEARDLTTGERGDFNAAFLRVGQYSVAVATQGFK